MTAASTILIFRSSIRYNVEARRSPFGIPGASHGKRLAFPAPDMPTTQAAISLHAPTSARRALDVSGA